MIKNDAKFIFCLSGFVGFLLFFLMSLLVHQDAVLGLLWGVSGCLSFSVLGRALLGLLLKGTLQPSLQSSNEFLSSNETNPMAERKSIANETEEESQAKAVAEAATNSIRTVDAKR